MIVSLWLFGNEMNTNDIYIYIYEETINVYTGNNNRFSEYIQEDPIDSYLLKMNVEKYL